MNFDLTEEQQHIREAIEKICARFGDDYWLKRDKEGGFPADFHQALAKDGWLGIAMPEEFGGAGLGIAEAAVMMQAIAESGAIIDYIIRRHGQGRLVPPPESWLYDEYVQWLHYAEGSAALPLIMKGTVSHLGDTWRPLKRQVDAELQNHLAYIDHSLAGHDYLVGDAFSAADVQLSFVGELAAFTGLSVERRAEGVMLAALHVEDIWTPDRQAEYANGILDSSHRLLLLIDRRVQDQGATLHRMAEFVSHRGIDDTRTRLARNGLSELATVIHLLVGGAIERIRAFGAAAR